MKTPDSSGKARQDRSLARAMKLAMVVWSVTMVINGSFIRPRSSASFAVVDWLVILRLICAAAGIALGAYLIAKRRMHLGKGSMLVIAYLVIALLSSLFSEHIRQSIGYSALLIGAGLLTVGLVSCQTKVAGLIQLETLFFAVLCFAVIKDTWLALFAPELRDAMITLTVPARLGTGLVPPNRLSIMGAIAFWISFKFKPKRSVLLLWALRVCLCFVVLGTRSRVSLLALMGGGVVWLWLQYKAAEHRGIAARGGLVALLLSGVILLALLFACDFGPLMSLLEVVNRGEDVATTMSLTGRTDIWALVLRKLASNPLTAIVGHGYGTSILIMRDLAQSLSFIPRHTHNTFFEFLLTMGIPGAILCVSFFLYGFRWNQVYRKSRPGDERSRLANIATIILIIIFLNGMTETYIARQVNFVLMALLTYTAILGQIECIEERDADS
ncbi:MAG: O-antigen ligase family protein [Verrucomicrobia bacterium]|nr:O-antigen ligase family protein [Verrucomicrobiota bacterium]